MKKSLSNKPVVPLENSFYQILQQRVDKEIAEDKNNDSLNNLKLEIQKMVGREVYDKDKIIQIIQSRTHKSVKPIGPATTLSPPQKRQVVNFLETNFLKPNLDTPAMEHKKEAVFPLKRVEDTLEVLTVIGEKTPAAWDIITQFIINNVFHNYFGSYHQKQYQGFMGDAQGLFYEENLYFALHTAFDFFHANKIKLNPSHQKSLEQGVVSYLTEQWLENLDLDLSGKGQHTYKDKEIEIGLELVKLYVSQLPEAQSIEQFKAIFNQYEKGDEVFLFIPQIQAICDKVLLEKQLGKLASHSPKQHLMHKI